MDYNVGDKVRLVEKFDRSYFYREYGIGFYATIVKALVGKELIVKGVDSYKNGIYVDGAVFLSNEMIELVPAPAPVAVKKREIKVGDKVRTIAKGCYVNTYNLGNEYTITSIGNCLHGKDEKGKDMCFMQKQIELIEKKTWSDVEIQDAKFRISMILHTREEKVVFDISDKSAVKCYKTVASTPTERSTISPVLLGEVAVSKCCSDDEPNEYVGMLVALCKLLKVEIPAWVNGKTVAYEPFVKIGTRKLQVGDKVKVKELQDFRKISFRNSSGKMDKYAGVILTIKSITDLGEIKVFGDESENNSYGWFWIEEMFQ